MKLRIRSVETKETLRIEAPDSSSLLDLKTLIASRLSSSIPSQLISLSLNRRDELVSPSPHSPIISLGLTSGDLLFFSLAETLTLTLNPNPNPSPPMAETLTLDPTSSNPQTANLNLQEMLNSDVEETLTLDPSSSSSSSAPKAPIIASNPPAKILNSGTSGSLNLNPSSSNLQAPNLPSKRPQELLNSDTDETLDSDPNQVLYDPMEVESDIPAIKKPPLVPSFLKRVMEAEKGEIKGNVGRVAVAVHAVLLESGFVVCGGDGFSLPEGWAAAIGLLSVRYTVPELVGVVGEGDVKAANLKFSVVGDHVSVYGFVSGDRRDVYRVCLNVPKVSTLLVSSKDPMGETEDKDVFQLWKTVKDGLSLPLLIDICEKNALSLPPCFMILPTEMKFKILELLRGVDVARIACTCSELKYLSLNEELWKHKFLKEFGFLVERNAMGSSWADKYAKCWAKKNTQRKIMRENISAPRNGPYAFTRFRGLPIIGGDYDLFPAIGDVHQGGFRLGFPPSPIRRNFSPPCNFGGRRSMLRFT